MKRSVTFHLRRILWFLLWNFYVGKTGCYREHTPWNRIHSCL